MEVRKVKGTENPADVFTKHLASAQVVETLLKLFGCEYRGGRPDGAPKLRPGEGTELGASLSVLERCYANGVKADAEAVLAAGLEGGAASLVERGGYSYVGVPWENELVPEAWSYAQTQLPHTIPGMEAMFPAAIASAGAGDRDYEPDPCLLEEAGRRIIGVS